MLINDPDKKKSILPLASSTFIQKYFFSFSFIVAIDNIRMDLLAVVK